MNGEFVWSFNTHSDLVHRWNQEALLCFMWILLSAFFKTHCSRWIFEKSHRHKPNYSDRVVLFEYETKTHERTVHAAAGVKFIFPFVDNLLNSNERIPFDMCMTAWTFTPFFHFFLAFQKRPFHQIVAI